MRSRKKKKLSATLVASALTLGLAFLLLVATFVCAYYADQTMMALQKSWVTAMYASMYGAALAAGVGVVLAYVAVHRE